MNEIIKVEINENQEAVVSGRMLHEGLGVETRYNDWFSRMCEYGFEENKDYQSFTQKRVKPQGGRPEIDHAIKLDMAKEICMIQRSEKGRKIRKYFIEVEKELNSPEKIMARAIKIAENKLSEATNKIKTLEQKAEEDKPKVIFADSVAGSKTSILIGELAKLIKQNGYDIGQNRLYDWLRTNGYLINRRGNSYNCPTQKSMDMKLFEVKERTIINPNNNVIIKKTVMVTGKGQIYFINKFKIREIIV